MTEDRSRVYVDVTDDDIAAGIRWSATNCPLARALVRVFDGATGASVGVSIAHVYFSGEREAEIVLDLSEKAMRLRRDFDYTRSVAPAVVEMVVREKVGVTSR